MNTTVRKRRWIKGVLFVLLFTCIGAVIGAGATVVHFRGSMHRVRPQRDAIAAVLVEKIRDRVDVTDGEAEQLTKLLDVHFDEIEVLRNESFQNMRGVFTRMDEGIKSVLGEERFGVWYEYKEKRIAEWRRGNDRARDPGRR
jgi:hypothetical protein